MYKVLADGKLLHDDQKGLRVSAAKLTLELGKSGLLEFNIHQNHPYYQQVQPLKTMVEVQRHELTIFRGRVLDLEYGFHNEKHVTCEGELGFLLDSIIEPHEYSGSFGGFLDFVLGFHNGQVEKEKQFKRGSVTVADYAPFEVIDYYNFTTSFDLLNQHMVEPSGGFLQVRHEYGDMYLDLIAPDMNISNVSAQQIRLGKNLLDIKRNTKGSEVFSGIIPLGAKIGDTERRLNITSVNGDFFHITNPEAVAAYGNIFRVVIFENITNVSTLLSEARNYLAESFAAVNEIEITAADLSGQNPDLDSFQVGQWVQLVSDVHFTQPQTFLIRKMTIDLSKPAETRIEVGRTRQGLTASLGYTAESINNFSNRISNLAGSIDGMASKVDTAATIADAASKAATEAKTAASTATTAANNAATKATAASTAASTAQTAANTAKTTADNAATKATTAQSTATAAQTTANNVANRVTVLEKVQPYVIQTGTTGIWKWKKFSDNTCEFFGKVPVTNYAISTALGGWYRGANIYEATTYAYPFSMTEAPAVEMTFQTRNGLAAIAWIFSADANTAQAYLPQCYLIRPVTGTGIYGNINIIGKGKLA